MRAAGRMVLANQKLVKAQAKTGTTSLNEYTGQQSNFIAKDQISAEGPLHSSRLAKTAVGRAIGRIFRRPEAPPVQDPIPVDEQPRPQDEGAEGGERFSTTEIERVHDDNQDGHDEQQEEDQLSEESGDERAEGRERFSTEVRRVHDDNSDDEA